MKIKKLLAKRALALPAFTKRQRFIIAVLVLSTGLFFSEYQFGKNGVFLVFLLAFLAPILLFISNYKDIKENFSPYLFILPFFYSLSFGLFYFLVPARFLTRMLITSLYALGLYSLFLSQNIFTVASIRTIALLSGARIVSLVITLVSYFFLANIVFSLRLSLLPSAFLISSFSFFLVLQSLWTITLENRFKPYFLWTLGLTLCLFEMSLILWFWPASSTVIALFLAGFFYTIVGLSQAWLDKRLFRGVMWEYIWVAAVTFFTLILFTSWRA